MAGSSSIRRISGPVPGLLDPTQSDRLFRLPGSRLQFASFDPLTATAQQNVAEFRKLSIDGEPCRPKRIVTEITPSGDSFWRYVPNARLDEGVEDEGEWPRHVEICGEVIECSQDQWDIYKLDPLYVCHVRVPPQLTQITRATDTITTTEALKRKRPASPSSTEGSARLPKQRKRACPVPDSHRQNGRDDVKVTMMDNIEVMDVDNSSPRDGEKADTTKTYRTGRKSPRRTSYRNDFENLPNVFFEDSQNFKKRKLEDIPESSLTLDDFNEAGTNEHYSTSYTSVQKRKRARTASPTSSRRELKPKSKQLEREQSKRQRREQDLLAKRKAREESLFQDLIAETVQEMQDHGGQENVQDSVEVDEEMDEEMARRMAIEESRRKLAELEADRPLWEAAAKKRLIKEEVEKGSIRVKVSPLHSVEKAEAERKARILRGEEERRKKEDERRQQEEAARRERERRRRQQQRWAFGPWTPQRALERYKILSAEFDVMKFSVEVPLMMEAVPWPILTSPTRLNIADINWDAVEKFFAAVKNYMKPQEYKELVEKSHRRFHPDRWRSRSLLRTVLDETERDVMEVAANTVAQALTPIWRAVTGR